MWEIRIRRLSSGKFKCVCTQGPQLDQTGWSGNHAEWICPVCKVKWYNAEDGELTTERPCKWPSKRS